MATDNTRAVSPAIGVVLLLAITVTLAATVAGAFLLGIDRPAEPDLTATLETDDTPEATFTFDRTRRTLTVTHAGGDTLAAERVQIRGDVRDGPVRWGTGEITEGDATAVTVTGTDVWVTVGGETVSEWSG